jgi:hypothetical protein
MSWMFDGTSKFNQDLTIWQALNDDLNKSVLNHCRDLKDLTPEYIESYLSKRGLKLKEQLKDLQTIHTDSFSIPIEQYRLLSNFKELKDKLETKLIDRERSII